MANTPNAEMIKVCNNIITNFGTKSIYGKLANHILGKKMNLKSMSENKINEYLAYGKTLFNGTSVIEDLENELNRRKQTKVEPKAELNIEVLNMIANETWSAIKAVCGMQLIYAWGMFKPTAFSMVGDNGYYRYGIKANVNGGYYKGKIAVVLDEGKDLYEVVTFKKNGEVKEKHTDVYAEDLKSILNTLIENNPDF